MAYPTDSLAKVLDEIDRMMIGIKVQSQARSAALSNGATAHVVIAIRSEMIRAIDRLNELKTTPGLVAYAKEQKNDVLLDVVTEFNAVIAAMQAVVSEIETTFPVDGNGYLLREKWSATDTSPRQFTSGNVANLKTQLDGVVAMIE